ncbi:class I SAM-dependent methyltransferase [Mycolicibacterium sp. XJ1819]
MARTDNDTWDLASSVGSTATMVAASRASASKGPRALIDDPFAEPLVRAVGVDLWIRLADGDFERSELGDDVVAGVQRLNASMTVRTKFFDEFFTASGVRQAVILASGLDSRAYRLAWPAGSTVYEIDQPDVIEFKTRTLAELGAQPTATRRTVAVDLRFDWPSALTAAGFDPSLPTAWSAEGLLGYLPPEAQDRLLDAITALSAPGSRVAIDAVPSIDPADQPDAVGRMREASQRWREQGFDVDFADLVYLSDRNDAADYLADHGWSVTRHSVPKLLADNDLPALDEDHTRFGEPQYITGTYGK